MKRTVAILLALAILLFPVKSYAAEGLYYAQNGEVGTSTDGPLVYYLTNYDGYYEKIELYILTDKWSDGYKTDYQFEGYSDYDPDLEDKLKAKLPDYFTMEISPQHAEKINSWDGEGNVYRMSIGVTPGKYSFLLGSLLTYDTKLVPLTSTLEDVRELNIKSQDDERLWFRVEEGHKSRVYGIYYTSGAEGEEDIFYEENIEHFSDWALEIERTLRETEAAAGYFQNGGETITVEADKDKLTEAALNAAKEAESPSVQIVEEAEEVKEEVPEDTPSRRWYEIGFISIAILVVSGLIVFAFTRIKIRRE